LAPILVRFAPNSGLATSHEKLDGFVLPLGVFIAYLGGIDDDPADGNN